MPRWGKHLTFTFFTNDIQLFCPTMPSECNNLLHILGIYGRASGQAINCQKMMLFFSPNTNLKVRENMRSMLDAQIVKEFEKYLGLLIMGGKNKANNFKNFQKRIVKWDTG